MLGSGRFTPGKTRYPLCRRLQGAWRWSGGVWKISPPCRFQPRTDPPLASRSTDHDIPDVLTYDRVSKIILVIKTADEDREEMS